MKIVDLTLEITSDMITFPGYPMPNLIKWSKFDIQGYVSEVVFLSTHTGTHMDAPFHFNPNGQTIDQVEVNRYICNNAILMKIQKNDNEMITSDDIIRNSKYEIKEKDSVVFSTGWEKQIKQKDNYIRNNPGLSKDAAEYLVEKKVNAVGIDCPSIDTGVNTELIAHKTLLSNEVLVIENLCNLDEFTNGKFSLFVAPLKLAGASGSPVRAIGIDE
ncbi:MAG TPA: cyclase family protein [Nitrososphaeraceae archaeon]|nr:cyclase family protein [Nitrososphaeraceae archaeon]